jgi:hypothetical protein
VLRFWNNEALGNTDGVLQRIALALRVYHRPSPYPLPRGERDAKRGIRLERSPHRRDSGGE